MLSPSSSARAISPEAQRRMLDLCPETLDNVRSLAVYLTQDYSTPEHGMAAIQFIFSIFTSEYLIGSSPTSSQSSQSRGKSTNLDVV